MPVIFIALIWRGPSTPPGAVGRWNRSRMNCSMGAISARREAASGSSNTRAHRAQSDRSDVWLTLGAKPSSIAPSGWKIGHILISRSLEQLLPFGPQACAQANIQDWRESGSHDPPGQKPLRNGLLKTLILSGF